MVASRLKTPHELSVDEEIGATAPELVEDVNEHKAAVSEVAADSRVRVAPVGHKDLELVEDDDCTVNLINHE